VVFGIGTSLRWSGGATPGFLVANLHRNLSLFSILLIAAHVATTVLDPFAKIPLRDVVVPFGAAYRPLWLGLGVAAAEILMVVAATSLLRGWLGPVRWKVVHWAAYASWPLAVFHGLGTGSDAGAPWLIGVTAACLAAVGLVLSQRLLEGRVQTLPMRLAAGLAVVALLYYGSAWAFQGPFQPGWAYRSGTPAALLKPPPVHPGSEGFSDPLTGVMVRSPAGATQVSLRDTVDTELTISVRSPDSSETLPVVTIDRGGRQVCQVPANVGTTIYAVCGKTRLTISLYGSGTPTGTTRVAGQLATSGPLGA
jgi:methionine sulfoxide reductase heme-binding subunit